MLEEAAAVEAGRIATTGLGVWDDEIPDLNTQEELADEPLPSPPEAPVATPRQTASIPIQMANDALLQIVTHLNVTFGKGIPRNSFIIDMVEKGLSKFVAVGSGSLARFAAHF